MHTILSGVIRGTTIELSKETGFADGQEVTVALEPIAAKQPSGEGLRRSTGSWTDDAADLDAYLEWNRQQRKSPRRGMAS